MNTLRAVAVVVTLVTASAMARADDLDPLIDLWSAKKYTDVLPRLYTYRKGPMGRTWRVDYMIGTSECHGPRRVNYAVAFLNNVPVYKDAPPSAVNDAKGQIRYCKNLGQVASASASDEELSLEV